ncbi:YhgE/Pip domain-containing protein [Streptacidiphilus sp. P02-A3a]|uniref:YhgE/Pip domain-containing protein n=1 Tax=Streptacidiphilus sp. P02-A3a TaxID=2704468 RepID=UPI0015FCB9AD|nr:YhgE/Pip domain-containing protein [Streptacidiphilus sp. P02-A3a]QMU71680.1 YhgE/Pip domain-containing protein [Streptacidiphilus sp. P02-A3a]
MTVFRLAWLELRRFRGPLRRFVPALLCLIPLLYGGMYLWANWNPYGHTDRIPVAVVNEDRPAQGPQGQPVDAGAQLVQQLKASPTFDWQFVSAAQAESGLRDNRYYFTVTIPSGFSGDLATAGTSAPERAGITLELNDANNYIAGIMTQVVQSKLQDQVDSAAHSAYVRAVYGELSGVRSQLGTASGAAGLLVDSTRTAEQGSAALSSGTAGLQQGSAQVATGAGQISQAAGQLGSLFTTLDQSAAQQLPRAAGSLVNAAGLASQGLSSVHSGTGLLQQGTSQAVSDLTALGDADPSLADSPAYQKAMKDARALDTAAGTLDGQAAAAASDATLAVTQATAVQSTAASIQSQLLGAQTTVALADSGASNVAAGSATVAQGLTSLQQGAQSLNGAAQEAHSGAASLSGTIDNALREIPPTDPTEVARAADVLGTPVSITETNLHPAKLYGRGMAPFFFGIALWVFGLFAYLLLRPVNLRALSSRVSTLTVAAAGWLPAAALGGIAALVLFTVVDAGLGLDPVNLGATILLLLLAAAGFTAVDHCLRTWLGTPGDVLSLVLLILQLTASGGLYPMPTEPVFFQTIRPLLPMTYLIDGLRVSISGGSSGNLVRDGAVLTAFAVLFVALTALILRRQRTWTVARLHPDVSL